MVAATAAHAGVLTSPSQKSRSTTALQNVKTWIKKVGQEAYGPPKKYIPPSPTPLEAIKRSTMQFTRKDKARKLVLRFWKLGLGVGAGVMLSEVGFLKSAMAEGMIPDDVLSNFSLSDFEKGFDEGKSYGEKLQELLDEGEDLVKEGHSIPLEALEKLSKQVGPSNGASGSEILGFEMGMNNPPGGKEIMKFGENASQSKPLVIQGLLDMK